MKSPAARYEKYDLHADARRAHNYLTSMVDPAQDSLPYWRIVVNQNPAYAAHCRVDDAELVASWSEALHCTMEILGTDDGREVLAGFRRHLLRSWGPKGLRYHEPYPWSNTLHSSFHEMAYVVSALNRWLSLEPDNAEVRRRLFGLTRGMRSLVWERRTRTFWSGDFPFEEPVYEFPNDVYMLDGGWDFSRVTGRGETSIRNGMMLQPLVEAYERFGDKVALDLAVGTANYLLGTSRYFNYRGEFFGHVHSATWVAGGLVRLARATGNADYAARGKQILDYVLSLSSSFGWVPEYAQWHPPAEESCETCCIKDAIFGCFEMIEAGHDEYWDVVNRFVRNQLNENQVKDGSFIGVDNSLPDEEARTYRDIDKRVVGGWSGGAKPNSISLRWFRSIAGCCVGTAPQALHRVWQNIVTKRGRRVTVNLPIDIDGGHCRVETGYPNEGWMQVTAKRAGEYAVRVLPFQQKGLRVTVNGRRRSAAVEDGCLQAGRLKRGDVIRLSHPVRNETRTEVVGGRRFRVTWRGCDVVKLSPKGDPLRLYQRESGRPKEIPDPPPPGTRFGEALEMRPTEQRK